MDEDDHTDVTVAPTRARESAPIDAPALDEGDDDAGASAPGLTPTRMTAAIAAADYPLDLGTSLGEYKIETVIGQGGMGVVYLAVHPLIGKRAAIKVLKKELCADPQAVQRFIDEARVVNEIGHPNIVDVFAFGEMPDGRSYLVMELLKGETMRARIARQPLDLLELAAVLRPLARALEAAHEKGIIHRDLKPDNVFFVDVRGEGTRVKLLDFGIAKLARRDARVERTATGTMMGTPQYIAPEQARGYAIDHRVDIYSLGCITFELLTGRPPFLADNAMDMIAKHLLEPPPRPAALAPDVPPELDDLVHAMMAKDAAERPGLDALIALLDRIGAGAPRAPTDLVPLRARSATPLPGAAVRVDSRVDSIVSSTASDRPNVAAAPEVAPAGGRRWPVIAAIAAIVVGAGVFVAVQQMVGTAAPPPAPVVAPVAAPAPAPAAQAARPVVTPLPDPPPAVVVPEPPPPPPPSVSATVAPPVSAPIAKPARPAAVVRPVRPKPDPATRPAKVVVPQDPDALMP